MTMSDTQAATHGGAAGQPPILYASDLALSGSRLKPTGVPAREAGHCTYCGKPIAIGETAAKPAFGQNFMDDLSLARRGSKFACGGCTTLIAAGPLRAFQEVLITADAVYPLATDVHRAWLLLTPPEPPYVAVLKDSMQQHLVWRTPVTLSNELQIIRLGHKLLRIRRPMLLAGLAAAEEAASLYLAERQQRNPKAKPIELHHPFVALTRKIDDLQHGQIRGDIAAIRAAKPALDILRQLTQGELWGLACLAKRQRPVPVKPDRIDFSSLLAAP